jgi:hypothetical protein
MKLQKNCYVNQVGEWRNEVWCWNFKWRRRLFVWEDESLLKLLELLADTTLSFVNDTWWCTIRVDGGYTVKDGYCFLSKNFLPAVEGEGDIVGVVKRVWESLLQ